MARLREMPNPCSGGDLPVNRAEGTKVTFNTNPRSRRAIRYSQEFANKKITDQANRGLPLYAFVMRNQYAGGVLQMTTPSGETIDVVFF